MLSELLAQRGDWTQLQPLRNYSGAPNGTGLYEIGFQIDGYQTPFCLDIGYPRNFRAMYVGITMRSLRDRLREHSAGGSKANRFVRLYSEEVQRLRTHAAAKDPRYASFFDGLYYTCITYALPAILECSRIQRAGGAYYPWNTRSEIWTLMAWNNSTIADLEKTDLKTKLSTLQSSGKLNALIKWAEIG
jgi:hypothetical protein